MVELGDGDRPNLAKAKQSLAEFGRARPALIDVGATLPRGWPSSTGVGPSWPGRDQICAISADVCPSLENIDLGWDTTERQIWAQTRRSSASCRRMRGIQHGALSPGLLRASPRNDDQVYGAPNTPTRNQSPVPSGVFRLFPELILELKDDLFGSDFVLGGPCLFNLQLPPVLLGIGWRDSNSHVWRGGSTS